MDGERSITIFQDGLGDGGQKMRTLHGRTSGPTRRSTKGQWTPEEDEILQKAVQRFKGKNWKKIAECFKDRTDVQCLHRWQKVLNPELVKGPWSKEEDEIIIELVNKYGPKKWSTIAQHLPGRIGKQCRERWHNHLNPAINKEAWTQEEELALIRAHQIYGNKWAELTKFLPGRTDNAIKNHWNSSVKKKLDSYLASGLLAQFPAHPHVGQQNQPIQSMPVSSLRMQGNGDDSGTKGVEAEEISECSQDSTVAGCFQSASEMANAVLHTREEFSLTEESGLGKEQSASPASCSEQYYTSLEDGAFTISEIPCEVGCSSKFLEQNFSGDAGTSAGRDHQFNLHALPNISSLELRQESSQMQTHCIGTNEGQEMVNVPCQTSVGLSTSMGYTAMGSHNPERILISDDECCRVLFSDTMYDGCFFSGNHTRSSNMVASGGCTDSFRDILISDTGGTSSSQSDCPPRSDIMGTSCSQSFVSVPSLVSVDGDALIYGDEQNQFFGSQEQEFVPSVHDDFIYTNGTANSPCNDGTDNTGMQEQPDLAKESSKLVPVNNFGSGSDITHTCPSMGERPNVHMEQQDTGALCYEPPRFPSLDIPFFSCDLIQSGTDMQQEYSPLGIRQFMMSSMNCITPFRSWDSPSRDDSPDALLKSAAKTFTGTPSILKKRNRDFLSPLSEKRSDKKLFNTSCLAKDFSRLDVMFDDSGTHKVPPISPSSNRKAPPVSPSSNCKRDSGAFIKDKENSGHAFEGGEVMATDGAAFSDDRISEKGFDNNNSQDMIKQGTVDVDTAVQIVQQPSGVLAEHDMNDLLLHSPDQVGFKADRVLLGSSVRTPRNRHFRNLVAASSHGISSKSSSGNPCAPVISPTTCGKKHESHSVAVTCIQSASSSSPLGTTGTNTGNDASIEPYNIFGVTPSKRSMESPSAWMSSPWFINSFLPGPRIDTEITVEDIGYFMSPGDRSYDAIGLMKQISEHTAAAYASAQEVLGNETPKTLLKEKYTEHGNLDQENNHVQHNQLGNRSHLAPNVLTERRTLDFSECGTPRKGTENGKSSNAISLSSPSSYLLKSCR